MNATPTYTVSITRRVTRPNMSYGAHRAAVRANKTNPQYFNSFDFRDLASATSFFEDAIANRNDFEGSDEFTKVASLSNGIRPIREFRA